VLEALDAGVVQRWARAASDALHAHRAEIDGLNVFPVADRDTGSNLALTMGAATDALADAVAADPVATGGQALAVLARAAVLGARGNSGVILSQLLRGLADAAPGADSYGAEQLRAGLTGGVRLAYAAVAEPVEGTILSVARAAAEGVPAAPARLDEVVRAAVKCAETALVRTQQQLPALTSAGVVDAGGRGLLLVLDALAVAVTGEASRVRPAAAQAPARRHAVRESGSPEFEYEVQYLLEAPTGATVALRESLSLLGDSVVVAGTGDGTWNVHVHVNDAGAAIEAGVAAGAVRQISVARFADAAPVDGQTDGQPGMQSSGQAGNQSSGQSGNQSSGQAGNQSSGPPAGAGPPSPATTAVVALAPGAPLARLFAREGITVVEHSAASPLAAADLVGAVEDTGAAQVVLLPNSEPAAGVDDVVDTAVAQVRVAGIRVTVVPTRSPVQGLAAVAVHDPARPFDDDVVAMAEAAAATRFAEIVIAAEQSLTSVGICEAGDILGMIDGEVVEIGRGLVPVAFSLVARLVGVGVELMTVLVGSGAPAGLGELIAGHVRELAPLADVTIYLSGQQGRPLIIGVE
jgi:DAK2 domain fusion protein YloV